MSNDSSASDNLSGSKEKIGHQKINLLIEATEKSVKTFSFKGIESYCKVSNVYDGDTCRVIFFYKGELTRVTVRLSGIDTPEMKSDNPNEVFLAKNAKEKVSDELLNKISYIKFGKNDKYKRPLVEIFPCEQNNFTINSEFVSINQILIENDLARAYDGGKKELW